MVTHPPMESEKPVAIQQPQNSFKNKNDSFMGSPSAPPSRLTPLVTADDDDSLLEEKKIVKRKDFGGGMPEPDQNPEQHHAIQIATQALPVDSPTNDAISPTINEEVKKPKLSWLEKIKKSSKSESGLPFYQRLFDRANYLNPREVVSATIVLQPTVDLIIENFIMHPYAIIPQIWTSLFSICQTVFAILLPIYMFFYESFPSLVPLSIFQTTVCLIDTVLLSFTGAIINAKLEMNRTNVIKHLFNSGYYSKLIIGGFPYGLVVHLISTNQGAVYQEKMIRLVCLINLLPFIMILFSDRVGILTEMMTRLIRKMHLNVAVTSGVKIVAFFYEIELVPQKHPGLGSSEKYVIGLFSAASEMLSAG